MAGQVSAGGVERGRSCLACNDLFLMAPRRGSGRAILRRHKCRG